MDAPGLGHRQQLGAIGNEQGLNGCIQGGVFEHGHFPARGGVEQLEAGAGRDGHEPAVGREGWKARNDLRPRFPGAHRQEAVAVPTAAQPAAIRAKADGSVGEGPDAAGCELPDHPTIAGVPNLRAAIDMVHGENPSAIRADRDVVGVGAGIETQRLARPVGVKDPATGVALL